MAVNAVQQFSLNKKMKTKNTTTSHSRKSTLLVALAIATVITVPSVRAGFLGNVKTGQPITVTVSRSSNLINTTAVTVFEISGSGISVLDAELVPGGFTPFTFSVTPPKRLDRLIIEVNPDVAGANEAFVVTLTQGGVLIIVSPPFTGDQRLWFGTLP